MAAIGLAGAPRAVQFSSQQGTRRGDLGELGHAMGRTLGTVSGAKGVHHEDVAQGSVLLRQLVGVLFLALVEAHVLEQHDVAGLDVNTAQVVGYQRHFATQSLAQVIGDRLEAVFGGEFTFGRATQVRADHHGRALFQRQLDGRQRGKNACVAGDSSVLDRDIEVFADQYTLTLQIKVGHLQHGHVRRSLFLLL
jgi:hypothetical protein